MDQLTKSAHFLAVKTTLPLDQLVRFYVREVVRLHRIPASIMSDGDPCLISQFWTSLHKALGTRLSFSMTFHPQTYGQSNRTIQTLEDMLRACVLDMRGGWEEHLPLVEFVHNNFQASIRKAPYKALYKRLYQTPIYWFKVGEWRLMAPRSYMRWWKRFVWLERDYAILKVGRRVTRITSVEIWSSWWVM